MRAFLQFRGSRAGPPQADWSFQRLICVPLEAGLRIVPQAGPAVSPTDKPRKDGALPPVTSEKPSYLRSNRDQFRLIDKYF